MNNTKDYNRTVKEHVRDGYEITYYRNGIVVGRSHYGYEVFDTGGGKITFGAEGHFKFVQKTREWIYHNTRGPANISGGRDQYYVNGLKCSKHEWEFFYKEYNFEDKQCIE